MNMCTIYLYGIFAEIYQMQDGTAVVSIIVTQNNNVSNCGFKYV